MAGLYDRLGAVGLSRAYVKKVVLPPWWEDKIARNPAGYAEALSTVARNLGLDLASLQDASGPILRYDLGPRRFKHRAHVTEGDLQVAECIALRAAQLACLATTEPARDLDASAGALRAALLGSGQSCLTFASLLDACWDHGIPVLHVTHFPQGVKKMDGLAARIGGRPAIVLSCKRLHSAWLEFHLGHEMGHIGRGHLKDDGVLVEDEEQRAEDAGEEREANEYAAELLTGKPDLQYASGRRLSAPVLAQKAVEQGREARIGPGALILNYAKATGDWAAATNALKIIEPEPGAITLIHAKMCERLEWDRLSEESAAFLLRVTGVDSEA